MLFGTKKPATDRIPVTVRGGQIMFYATATNRTLGNTTVTTNEVTDKVNANNENDKNDEAAYDENLNFAIFKNLLNDMIMVKMSDFLNGFAAMMNMDENVCEYTMA